VDRAALPDEAGAEFLEDAIDLHQCAPEARGEFAIVVMVLSILLEWDPIRHFTSPDPALRIGGKGPN
jgi:hypothetical protein